MVDSASPGPRSYTDLNPRYEWLHGDEADTLRVNVPGFNKKQMKVLINTSANIKISGERPLNGRKSIRFQKEFKTPLYCNPKEIQAKFDKGSGLLHILLPKQANQGGNHEKRVAAAGEDDDCDGRAPPRLDEDEGGMHGPELGMYGSVLGMGGRDVGTSRHKLLINNAVMAVMVLLGIGAYAVYRIWFAHEEKEN